MYNEEFKNKVRADYMTGEYSLAKLGEKHGIQAKTAMMWCRGYQKGGSAVTVEELRNKAAFDTFNEVGLTDKRVYARLKRLILHSDNEKIVKDCISLYAQIRKHVKDKDLEANVNVQNNLLAQLK